MIGSGIAGLTVALRLRAMGVNVTLYEKSRGPGGRLASKRVSDGAVDCGAQYFTIRTPGFREFLVHYAPNSYRGWNGRLVKATERGNWTPFLAAERFVGVPRMSALSRALSDTLDIRTGVRITRLYKIDTGQWWLEDDHGRQHGEFDAVVVTAPPAQTEKLLRDSGLEAAAAKLEPLTASMQACWAVMVRFDSPLELPFEAMETRSGPLRWAANDSSKPDRDHEGEWWVLHGAPQWSNEHAEASPEDIKEVLLGEFCRLSHRDSVPVEVLTHRWLYARSSDTRSQPSIWFQTDRLGVCGDWLQGGRVEGAFESAERLVAAITLSRQWA